MSQTIQSRLGLALGALALFISLGGESFAKGTIHAVLKTGVVTSRTIHDNTIQSQDLSKSLRAQLAKTGAAGPAGPQGPQGPQGPAGPGVDTLPAGAIGTTALADGSVSNVKLADGSVTTPKLANDAVTTAKIALGAVNSTGVANESLTDSDLATNSVKATEIADDSIDSGEIFNDSLYAIDLASNSVGNSELASNAVDSASVVNDSLTATDINGGDSSGAISLAAGFAANGACKDIAIAIGGAEVGDAVVFSVVDPVPEGVLLYGVGVPSDGHMTLKACNFTGGAFPALSNIAIRALTFG